MNEINTIQAGEMLGYSRQYVARLCHRGKLKARKRKMGGQRVWCIDAESVIDYMEEVSQLDEIRYRIVDDTVSKWSRLLKAVGDAHMEYTESAGVEPSLDYLCRVTNYSERLVSEAVGNLSLRIRP